MRLTVVDYMQFYEELQRELQRPISGERCTAVLDEMKSIRGKLKEIGVIIISP